MKPLIPVLVLAAAAALSAGCGDGTPAGEAARSASASASSDDHHDHGGGDPDAPAQPTSVTLGAPVSLTGEADGEEFEVTYNVTKLGTAAETDDGTEPASGKVFVVATVEVHSYRGSHRAGPGNEDYVFTLLDKKDKGHEPAKAKVGRALDGTVEEEKTLKGTVVFEVPESAAETGRVRLKAAGANSGDQTVIWKPE